MQATALGGLEAGASEEDEYDPALLEAIPDVAAPPDKPGRAAIATLPSATPNLKNLIAQLELRARESVAKQLEEVEGALSGLVGEQETRIAELTAETARLEQENQALQQAHERFERENQILQQDRERYERAFKALRELTRDLESA